LNLRKPLAYAGIGIAIFAVVQAKQWYDTRLAGPPMEELIKSSWLSANEAGLRLSVDSPFESKVYVRDRLTKLQAMIASAKRPMRMDNLRLAYVEEHIAKMNAAIELDESQQLLDRRL
jgi:hypothetical protein